MKTYNYSLHVYGSKADAVTEFSIDASTREEADSEAADRLGEFAGESMSGDEGSEFRFVDSSECNE